MPRFSIITPTVLRPTLLTLCDAIDLQTFEDWEHLIAVDGVDGACPPETERRHVYHCEVPHRNGGNSCRHQMWNHAKGDFLVMWDDDNYPPDVNVLQDINTAISQHEDKQWFLFPILRHGSRFFYDPPQPCYVDTGNVIARREIARWPDIEAYCSDGVWVDGLKQYPYQAFPNFRPIMIMPTSNFARQQ